MKRRTFIHNLFCGMRRDHHEFFALILIPLLPFVKAACDSFFMLCRAFVLQCLCYTVMGSLQLVRKQYEAIFHVILQFLAHTKIVMVVGDQRVHLVIVYTLQSRFILRSKLPLRITLQFMHTHVSKQLFRRVGIADLVGNKPLYLFRARFVICLEQLTDQM